MPEATPILIVGAGFAGATVARQLAERGHRVDIHDARGHIGGNCHTARDPGTGVMRHVYGPHIFHTSDAEVWDYVQRFGAFRPYLHRVMTTTGGQVYSMPVNLLTINQFFRRTMTPEEARSFLQDQTREFQVDSPANFEEQALSLVGRDLYEAFFKGYTVKQWGLEPEELPASIFRRLPLRFTYDDRYFSHTWQAIPEAGYTAVVEAMLDHPGIRVSVASPVSPIEARSEIRAGRHVVWTGPIDSWFDHDEGHLGYRTLDFEDIPDPGDGQGCAVMNYGDLDTPWTRVSEHRHFAPWEDPHGTFLIRETSRLCCADDIPYYPIRLAVEKGQLARYCDRALSEKGVTFAGRLGTYRYLDMDVTIRESLDLSKELGDALQKGDPAPVFSRYPL